jgi:hypothetical protein
MPPTPYVYKMNAKLKKKKGLPMAFALHAMLTH